MVQKRWRHYPAVRPSTGSTGSEQVFRIMNEWIGEFVSSHAYCGAKSDVVLPTQVLDVGVDAKASGVRLIESTGV